MWVWNLREPIGFGYVQEALFGRVFEDVKFKVSCDYDNESRCGFVKWKNGVRAGKVRLWSFCLVLSFWISLKILSIWNSLIHYFQLKKFLIRISVLPIFSSHTQCNAAIRVIQSDCEPSGREYEKVVLLYINCDKERFKFGIIVKYTMILLFTYSGIINFNFFRMGLLKWKDV